MVHMMHAYMGMGVVQLHAMHEMVKCSTTLTLNLYKSGGCIVTVCDYELALTVYICEYAQASAKCQKCQKCTK